MGKLPCKVVRTELILRILAILQGVKRPFCQSAPMLLGKARIGALLDYGSRYQKHIAALFQRHPVSIVLPVSIGVYSDIVGSPDFIPLRSFRIVEDEVDHGLGDLRIVSQEERQGRISHIDGPGASVGEVLL